MTMPVELESPLTTESGLDSSAPAAVPVRSWIQWVLGSLGLAFRTMFGLASLLFLLAAVATVPIVQMMSLGYLLEVSGRVAREGRLRAGVFGWSKAGRVGSVILGGALIFSPLLLVNHLSYVAYVVDASGAPTQSLHTLAVVATLALAAHGLSAWYAGAKLRHLLWPLWFPVVFYRLLRGRRPARVWFPPAMIWRAIREGRLYAEARDAFWTTITGWRLPYYFWLGLRGFLGGVAWLILPVSCLVYALDRGRGVAPLIGVIGGVLFVIVLFYLPFLQVQFAADRRLRSMFEVRRVRAAFGRAPLAFLLALILTLVLATPLYLLKIEYTPREIAWLPALVFVVFAVPARLATGWALARSARRTTPRHRFFRVTGRLAMLPLVGAYVAIVFLTQYASWYGTWSLLEQHAFLLPVPFLGGN